MVTEMQHNSDDRYSRRSQIVHLIYLEYLL